jgi:selenium metabolism protein YedF
MPNENNNQTNKYTILIKSNRMGSGNDDLGKILIRGFLNSLIKQEQLPSHIILYNAGVLLAVKDSDTAASMLEMEQRGVQIVLCGTCVDFFQIKEQIAAGQISNMAHITSLLIDAPKVIVP